MVHEAATFSKVKPFAIWLIVGLVAGPLISNYAGWQVTRSHAAAATRDGVVEQMALICEQRARADVAAPAKLDWDARGALAKKWAAMPGPAEFQVDAARSCASKLAT